MLISQDDFSDEDVVENCLLAQTALDSNPNQWLPLSQAGLVRFLRRHQDFIGTVVAEGFDNGKVVCSLECAAFATSRFGVGLEVDSVGVHPDHRGRSIAQSLYEAIIAGGQTLYAGDQTPSGTTIWINIIENSGRPVFAILDDGNDTVEQVRTKAQYRKLSRVWPNPVQFVLPHDGPMLDTVRMDGEKAQSVAA